MALAGTNALLDDTALVDATALLDAAELDAGADDAALLAGDDAAAELAEVAADDVVDVGEEVPQACKSGSAPTAVNNAPALSARRLLSRRVWSSVDMSYLPSHALATRPPAGETCLAAVGAANKVKPRTSTIVCQSMLLRCVLLSQYLAPLPG